MLRHGHFSRSFQASFAAMEVVAAAAAQWLWRTAHHTVAKCLGTILHIWICTSKNSQVT